MAVKAKEALYEEEPSEEPEDEALHNEEEGATYDVDQLHELHQRISQTYPLSEEALGVLHTALLSLNKRSNLHPDSLLSPLLTQLKSLRTLIPPTQGDEGSTSCVITGALNYLEHLNKVTQSLKEGIQESTSLSGGSSKGEVSPIEAHAFSNVPEYAGLIKVESISNAKLHILVHCKKREGLLSSLILALDTLGLVIDQMDISHNDVFMVDALTTKVDEKSIDDEIVREALWKIIHQGL